MNLVSKAFAAGFTNIFESVNSTASKANSGTSWQVIVQNVINIILMVAGALAVIFLIYSGILYITAAGNPDSAKKGQQGIINAVIGIVIIAAAYFIIGIALNLSSNVTGR